MSIYSLSHLSDQALLADLAGLVAADRHTTAALLAHIAEVDARGLFLPAACSSMHVYCVRVLHLAEDAAFKRIRAARAARRFPQIFTGIADGSLHLSGVVLLAPHLTDDNADDLLAAACGKSKAEIELLLARHAPRPDLKPSIEPLAGSAGTGAAEALAPGPPPEPAPSATKARPLAPERFALQVTIDQATHDKLVRAQALLRHRLPSGDLAQVLDRALDALLAKLEKEKFGATPRPRAGKDGAGGGDPHHVPSAVKRAVHARDGEQCSFVSADGERCGERGFLELDHRDPVALGGQATAPLVRVLCAPHNQYEAERILGTDFMQARRTEARTARAATVAARAAVAAPAPAMTANVDAASDSTLEAVAAPAPASTAHVDAASGSALETDAMRALRTLGFKATEARLALTSTAHVPATTLEQRIRSALIALHSSSARGCREAAPVLWQTGQHSL